ncbi:MAG: ribonuclease Z, partial [Planctomycetota bacterium]
MDRLFFLGSGDAFCHDSRANQAILIERPQDSILLDCGPTTRYRFKQTHKDLDRVKAILITHFHGDHLAGVPFCLLYWHYESRRTQPLHLVGPYGLKKTVENLVLGTYSNLLTENRYPIHFHEFPETNQGLLEVEDFTVQGFPMKH